MKDDDSEISDIFVNITPEDFFRDTSAHNTTTLTEPKSGAAAFITFVDANIQAVRHGFDSRPADETWDPMAILQSGAERRAFTPDDDETNDMFMSRLHREAEEMGATWFFTAMIGPVGMWADSEDLTEDPNRQVVAILWYAESREPDFRHLRQGVVTISDGETVDLGLGGIATYGGTTGINYEGDPSGAADLFKAVLHQKVL